MQQAKNDGRLREQGRSDQLIDRPRLCRRSFAILRRQSANLGVDDAALRNRPAWPDVSLEVASGETAGVEGGASRPRRLGLRTNGSCDPPSIDDNMAPGDRGQPRSQRLAVASRNHRTTDDRARSG